MAAFDFAPLFRGDLPAPAGRWSGLPKYNFVGGNNDADEVPVAGLVAAASAALAREGCHLATYNLGHGPQGYRPPALYAMSDTGNVVHIGSFSKSIAPALRVGYIVAPWPVLARALAIKADAGSGALEQMVLAEYCAPHFRRHVDGLTRALRRKLDTLMDALAEQFGTAAEFAEPKGGIFLWVKLPEDVDTLKLYPYALAAGVAINPGPEWSVDAQASRNWMRLCFASATSAELREGVAILAEVCRRKSGVPARSGNVSR